MGNGNNANEQWKLSAQRRISFRIEFQLHRSVRDEHLRVDAEDLLASIRGDGEGVGVGLTARRARRNSLRDLQLQ